MRKDIYGLTKAGVGIGVGSAIGAGLAAKAPSVSVTPAFATMGSMMSPVVTATMGHHALRMAKKLMPKKKRLI